MGLWCGEREGEGGGDGEDEGGEDEMNKGVRMR